MRLTSQWCSVGHNVGGVSTPWLSDERFKSDYPRNTGARSRGLQAFKDSCLTAHNERKSMGSNFRNHYAAIPVAVREPRANRDRLRFGGCAGIVEVRDQKQGRSAGAPRPSLRNAGTTVITRRPSRGLLGWCVPLELDVEHDSVTESTSNKSGLQRTPWEDIFGQDEDPRAVQNT